MKQSYLSWLSAETDFNWNNDSALQSQVENAVTQGAIGITTNPPLSYEALTTDSGIYASELAAIDKSLPDNEYALLAMSLVVKHFSEYFMEMFKNEGGLKGCVRAQVAPNLSADAEEMMEAGMHLAKIGKNVMVKIPGTKAGLWTLEELASKGIPTNPTVVTTVSQAIAAAEAYERGRERAVRAGITPANSSCAIVMGRAQDYFTVLNKERNLGLAIEDLEWAALAIVKRSYNIYRERAFNSMVMPAAFRASMQVEQLAGGNFHATIHPKIQAAVEAASDAGTIRRELFADSPVDETAIQRVMDVLPEFRQAYEPNGLTIDEFDDYGAVVMTLDGFDGGWKKLVSLKTI